MNNNIYYKTIDQNVIIPITNDGSDNQFNGVFDWIYEEETFSSADANWISPSGSFITFLSLNETMVQDQIITLYDFERANTNETVQQHLRYPPPGTPNPIVDVRIYDTALNTTITLDLDSIFPPEDRIVAGVFWTSAPSPQQDKDGEEKCMLKVLNRVQDHMKVLLVEYDAVNKKFKEPVVMREQKGSDGRKEGSDGWVEVVRKYV